MSPDKAHNATVGIVAVNWNGWRDTLDCLASLDDLDYPNFWTVVVDNGSTDGSVARIRQAFPPVDIIETGENLGFAGGSNIGISRAIEHGADFVWLLNNDTEVHPESLTHLVAEARSDAFVGMVGSKIYYHNDPDTLWFAGGTVNKFTGQTGHVGMGERDTGRWDLARDVDYPSGCSMLVAREVIEDIGLLDTKFFLYFEETDWATRARRKGWRVRYQPASKVWHKISKSAEYNSPGMIFNFVKSGTLFTRKHAPWKLPLAIPVLLRHHVLPFLVRGKPGTAIAGIRGVKAGLMER